MVTTRADLPVGLIAEVCRRHGVAELRVFGSILHNRLTPSSDVDFLVVFQEEDLGPWMHRLHRFEQELSSILGRPADVVPPEELKWVLRGRVLGEAEVVYSDTQ